MTEVFRWQYARFVSRVKFGCDTSVGNLGIARNPDCRVAVKFNDKSLHVSTRDPLCEVFDGSSSSKAGIAAARVLARHAPACTASDRSMFDLILRAALLRKHVGEKELLIRADSSVEVIVP
jgi:hypothetical protein